MPSPFDEVTMIIQTLPCDTNHRMLRSYSEYSNHQRRDMKFTNARLCCEEILIWMIATVFIAFIIYAVIAPLV